jgi:phosphoribosyl 1,2-cyclic phosphodiesterase
MNIQVHALASGSSGNAVLVQADDHNLLIDAGLGIRTLMPALSRRGVVQGKLDALLLTHEHDDHCKWAAAVSARLGAPVVANRATLSTTSFRMDLPHTYELATEDEAGFGPFGVTSFPVSHDAAEPVGYVIEVGDIRIAYATDVGCPTEHLRAALRKADLCILESNHDLDWLWRGSYPRHLKARVASDRGHLSNRDACTLIVERLEEGGPTTFWLAHLSSSNNSPAFARRYADEQVRAQTRVPHVLDIALRDRPSVSWSPGAVGQQLSLFD